MMEGPPKFSRKVFAQLWRITRPFFFARTSGKGRMMLVLLVLFTLAVTGVTIWMSFVAADFMTSLEKRNSTGYYRAIWTYVAIFALAIPLAALYRYTEERLALAWRDFVARTLMKRYFHNRAYYRLNWQDEIDNPDQRIAEDVKNFTITALSFLLILINSIIQIVSWASVLFYISAMLVWVLLGYAVLGTVATFLIGKRLIGLNYLQYEREADMRHGLIRVNDHAESIAFYRGERRELRDLRSRLGAVVGNMLVLIRWNRNLAFFTTGYNYLALLLPIVITAPLFLQGKIEFGKITQAGSAFAAMLAAVSLLITQFERLSQFAASITRLGALWDYLDEQDAEEDLDAETSQIEISEDERTLNLEELTVKTPGDGRVLLSDLTFRLPSRGSLLIMGESGSGKSSLLRTIAGLWSSGEGKIGRPSYRKMMFLPQRPYMIPGSLRKQLEYPGTLATPTDEELHAVLEEVNLPMLAGRVNGDFDAHADWANMLSLGEQQRVSFARLLLQNPAIAFLDESTSALDEPNEELLYEYLKKNKYTYVSVGHRSTLIKYHQWLLRIGKDAQWELLETKDLENSN